MRDKGTLVNIDNSDLAKYPNGRIKNQTGSGDGTPVNEFVYGDLHEAKDKLMRLYGISYNGLPDNEQNGYQLIDALIALASKNDFTLNLSTSSGVLEVGLKLGNLKENETFILKVLSNKTTETSIKGTDGVIKSVSFLGDYKAGEYVRMIVLASSILLVRMVDSFNFGAIADELSYLKGASQTQEDAGALTSVATTPKTNKTSFEKRVIGADSSNYLALPTGASGRNGLLSKEDKKKIDEMSSISSVFVITQGSDIQVEGFAGGYKENNFNFNYVDVFPPTGKTMSNLKGFICSQAEAWLYGSGNDDSWCKHQIQANKVRVICGCTAPEKAFHVNWLAIWI